MHMCPPHSHTQSLTHLHSHRGYMYLTVTLLSSQGLVALRSDEVMELMAEEYPQKYQEYMDVVEERQFKETLRNKIIETKKVASMGVHVSGNQCQ